jgi:hypothetical protein
MSSWSWAALRCSARPLFEAPHIGDELRALRQELEHQPPAQRGAEHDVGAVN